MLIEVAGELPNLLVPLKSSAAFMLATRKGLMVFENLLTNSLRATRLDIDREASPSGYSPSSWNPLWATWIRPRRPSQVQEEDYIYLISEDGHIYYLIFEQDVPAEGVTVTHVGNSNCHVDSACAPFGQSDQEDVLVIQGESSEGCVWTVGSSMWS